MYRDANITGDPAKISSSPALSSFETLVKIGICVE